MERNNMLEIFKSLPDDTNWKNHSYLVANAAYCIAKACNMDVERAYILGLFHDVGRSVGNIQARHIIEGYKFMKDIDSHVARICLTHTFQYKNIDAIYDNWDCSDVDKNFIKKYLDKIEYNDWDLLIQFCDSISLVNNYCTVEKKIISSIKKNGYKPILQNKIDSILKLKEYFDDLCKTDVYSLLKGEIEFEY